MKARPVKPSWRERVAERYGRSFLVIESLGMVLLAVALYVLSARGGHVVIATMLRGRRPIIYGACASVLGTLLGFTMTSFSIMIGLVPRPAMKFFRTKYPAAYRQLWAVFKSALRALLPATVLAIVALIVDHGSHPLIPFLVLAMVLVAMVRVARCGWVLASITDLITQDSEGRNQA